MLRTSEQTLTSEGGVRKFLTLADLKNEPPMEWLVEGLIPAKALVFVSGEPGKGKTTLVLNLLASMAAGSDCLAGHFKVPRPCRVAYLCGEKWPGVPLRVTAAAHAQGLDTEVPFYVHKGVPQLLDPTLGIPPKEVIEAIQAEIPDGLDVVVIDTFAAATLGADEIDPKSTKQVIDALQKLVSALDCTVVVLHHPAKGHKHGLRGSSVLLGAANTLIEIVSDGSVRRMVCGKQSDAEEFQDLPFRLVTSELFPGAAVVDWLSTMNPVETSWDKVFRFLEGEGGRRFTAGEIARALDMQAPQVRQLLGRELKNGVGRLCQGVAQVGMPTSKSNPNVYWLDSVPNT